MDHVGPFEKSTSGKKYLIVAIEQVIQWVDAKVVSSESAVESARFFAYQIVSRHRAPRFIASD